MPSFLSRFFPSVADAQNGAKGKDQSAYCTFDDAKLQLWTSSMCLLERSQVTAFLSGISKPSSGAGPDQCCSMTCQCQGMLEDLRSVAEVVRVNHLVLKSQCGPCSAGGISVPEIIPAHWQEGVQHLGRCMLCHWGWPAGNIQARTTEL